MINTRTLLLSEAEFHHQLSAQSQYHLTLIDPKGASTLWLAASKGKVFSNLICIPDTEQLQKRQETSKEAEFPLPALQFLKTKIIY